MLGGGRTNRPKASSRVGSVGVAGTVELEKIAVVLETATCDDIAGECSELHSRQCVPELFVCCFEKGVSGKPSS